MPVLNWLLRYQPVIDILDRDGPATVLDVGSGWHGLSWYWPRPVVQADVEFGDVGPSDGRAGVAHQVRSTAEALPFADGAFDYVVSLDLIEHLPDAARAAAVRELARVARVAVIVGYPSGPAAQRCDRTLDRMLRATPARLVPAWPTWLDEHRRQRAYPDRRTLDARCRPAGGSASASAT